MPTSSFKIKYIPPKVSMGHLGVNGKLLTDEQINSIKSSIKANGRYRELIINQQEVRLPYAVIVHDGAYYAVYSGASQFVLGEGGFGKVKLAQNLETGEWAALKVQGLKFSYHNILTLQLNEADILERNHRLTLSPANSVISLSRFSKNKNQEQQYLMLEIIKGKDLYDLMECSISLPRVIYLDVVIKALMSLKQFHECGYIHRDNKLENVIYDVASLSASVIDFGLSIEMDRFGRHINNDEFAGTRGYIPPELIGNGLHVFDEKSDVYQMGALIAYMFKFAPMLATSPQSCEKLYDDTDTQFFNVIKYLPVEIAKEIRSFLLRMLADDRWSRPTVDACIDFFKLQQLSLKPTDRHVKVALLSIRSCPRKLSMRKMREISLYHLVCLVDIGPDCEHMPVYIDIKHQLEVCGISVYERVFKSRSKEELFKNALDQFLDDDSGIIWKFSYISFRKMPSLSHARMYQPVAKSKDLFKDEEGSNYYASQAADNSICATTSRGKRFTV